MRGWLAGQTVIPLLHVPGLMLLGLLDIVTLCYTIIPWNYINISLLNNLKVTNLFICIIQFVSWCSMMPEGAPNRHHPSPQPPRISFEPPVSQWRPCVWSSACYAPCCEVRNQTFNLGRESVTNQHESVSNVGSAPSQQMRTMNNPVYVQRMQGSVNLPKLPTVTANQYLPLTNLTKYDVYQPVLELPRVSNMHPSVPLDVPFSVASQVGFGYLRLCYFYHHVFGL